MSTKKEKKKKEKLTVKEGIVLYGLNKFPEANNRELSEKFDLNESTVALIRNRLVEEEYFYELIIPQLNRVGCELMGIVLTQFNPLIPITERIVKTRKLVRDSDEIFLSVEEGNNGFLFSITQNYTKFKKFYEMQTETLGKLGFLAQSLPEYIIFPFETSHFIRFYDYWRLLENIFSIDGDKEENIQKNWFKPGEMVELNLKEKKVYCALIEYPNATMQTIGERVDLSRYSVARKKKKFFEEGLLKKLYFPNLQKLGLNIIVLYYIKFNPVNPPNNEDLKYLDSKNTLFFVHSKLEAVIISAYSDYKKYKDDSLEKMAYMKENNIIIEPLIVRDISVEKMEILKGFISAPMARKILGIEKSIFNFNGD